MLLRGRRLFRGGFSIFLGGLFRTIGKEGCVETKRKKNGEGVGTE